LTTALHQTQTREKHGNPGDDQQPRAKWWERQDRRHGANESQ
jgi:hypothetical protein